MRTIGYFACALAANAVLAIGPALAATCQAGGLTCATTMPPGGYCECTAHGNTEGGTVVTVAVRKNAGANATAGGCGAHPNDAGCK